MRRANPVRLNHSPLRRSLEIGMQRSARQAPCGFNSNSLMRGRSAARIQRSFGSGRTLSSTVERSPYRTVAAGTGAAKEAAAAPETSRNSLRSMAKSVYPYRSRKRGEYTELARIFYIGRRAPRRGEASSVILRPHGAATGHAVSHLGIGGPG